SPFYCQSIHTALWTIESTKSSKRSSESSSPTECFSMSPNSTKTPERVSLSEQDNFYLEPTPVDAQPLEEYNEWDLPENWSAVDESRFIESPAHETPNTYISFGDNSTTSTVTSYGKILQITKYFGIGASGFFTVDLPDMTTGVWTPLKSEPRTERLLERSADPSQGLGLSEPSIQDRAPRLRFADDRWPYFEFETQSFSMILQYSILEDIVVQNYVLRARTQSATSEEYEKSLEEGSAGNSTKTSFRIHLKDLGIREMDRMQPYDRFNFESPKDKRARGVWIAYDNWILDQRRITRESKNEFSGYETLLGPKKRSFVVAHHFGPYQTRNDDIAQPNAPSASDGTCADRIDEANKQSVNPKAVGLVVSLFVNGKAQEADEEGWSVHFDSRHEEKMTVTIAYRLQLMSNMGNGWRSTMISARKLFESSFYPDLGYQQSRLSEDGHLDFIFRRNLEHILSVCAIRSDIEWKWNPDHGVFEQHKEDDEGMPCVAITCGDFSGHDIESSASFACMIKALTTSSFAFKFLLDVFTYLQNDEEGGPASITEPASSLGCKRLYQVKRCARIQNTCKAHLNWIYKKAWSRGTNCFVWSHRASGHPIGAVGESCSERPRGYPEPFQIIKTFYFAEYFTQTQPVEQQGSTRNPGSGDSGSASQDLTDREWNEKYTASLGFLITPSNNHVAEAAKRWKKELSSRMTQDEYLFHERKSNGIAAFHLEINVWMWMAIECLQKMGLLTGSHPKGQLAQLHGLPRSISAESAQEIILRRFLVHGSSSLKQKMVASSRTVLGTRYIFRSTDTALIYASLSGFFDATETSLVAWKNTVNVQSRFEKNEDSKFQKPLRYGLELLVAYEQWRLNQGQPEDLFNHAKRSLQMICGSHGLFPGQIRQSTQREGKEKTGGYSFGTTFELPYILWIAQKGPENVRRFGNFTIASRIERNHENGNNILQGTLSTNHGLEAFERMEETDPDLVTAFFAKKHMPPNHSFNLSRVIEIPDLWLYRPPGFFSSEINWPGTVFGKQNTIKDMVIFWLDLAQILEDLKIDPMPWDYSFFDSGLKRLFRAFYRPDEREESESDWAKEKKASIKDVPESGSPEDGNTWPKWDMMENLEFSRKLCEERTEANAKKRVIRISKPYDDIAVLCACASDFERMLAFFKRHFIGLKAFLDVAVRATNFWETELHISFWQLSSDTDRQEQKDLSPPEYLEGFALKDHQLVRAAIGFRFDGDFLDRFWTCHIIENLPIAGNEDSYLRFESAMEVHVPSYDHTRPWAQRRVFEQMILDRMLSTMWMSTQKILVFFEVMSTPSHSFLSSDYFSSIDQWRDMVYALDRLNQEIRLNLEQLEGWERREQDRGEARPRWTLKDENKYHYTISFWKRVNRQNIRDLRTQQAKTQLLITRIESIRASFRDDMNLRSAEDVRVFTSVTVVFLPLGFAAAIFSMNGIPERSLITTMAKTAAAALFITLFFLVCVKLAGDAIKDVVRGLKSLILDRAMKRSVLHRRYHDSRGQSKPTEQEVQLEGSSIYLAWRLRRLRHGLWHIWHWISYFMQEIPGRQLALAYGSLHSLRNWQNPAETENDPNTKGTQMQEPSEEKKSEAKDQPKESESPLRRKNTGSQGNTPTSTANNGPKDLPGRKDTESSRDDKNETPEEVPKDTKRTKMKKATKAALKAVIFAIVVIVGIPIWLVLGFKNGVMKRRYWKLGTFVFHSLVFTLLLPFFVPVSMINLVALNFIDVFRFFRQIGEKSTEKEKEKGAEVVSKEKDEKDGPKESQEDKPAEKEEEQDRTEAILEKCLVYPAFARPFRREEPLKDMNDLFQSFLEIFRGPFTEVWEMVGGSLPSWLSRAKGDLKGPRKRRESSGTDDVV
ncbi:uncharacterized protein J3D65DRAFT_693521, partial [Phyllosticta citribraziliensis]